MKINTLIAFLLIILLNSNYIGAQKQIFLAPPQIKLEEIEKDFSSLFDIDEMNRIITREDAYEDEAMWEIIRNRFCSGHITEAVYLMLSVRIQKKYFNKKQELLTELSNIIEAEKSLALNVRKSRFIDMPVELTEKIEALFKELIKEKDAQISKAVAEQKILAAGTGQKKIYSFDDLDQGKLLFSLGSKLAELGGVTVPLSIAEFFLQNTRSIKYYHEIVSCLLEFYEVDNSISGMVLESIKKAVVDTSYNYDMRMALIVDVLFKDLMNRGEQIGTVQVGDLGVALAGGKNDFDLKLAHKVAQQLIHFEQPNRAKNPDYDQAVRIGEAIIDNHIGRHALLAQDIIVELMFYSPTHTAELAHKYLSTNHFLTRQHGRHIIAYLRSFLEGIGERGGVTAIALRLDDMLNKKEIDTSL